MFGRKPTPQPAQVWEANPESITDTFRENLQRVSLKNDNEIVELERIIADAEARLAHRKSVKNAMNAALVELDIAAATDTVARDVASISLRGTHSMEYANAV